MSDDNTFRVGVALLDHGLKVHVPPPGHRGLIEERDGWSIDLTLSIARSCLDTGHGHGVAPLPLEIRSRDDRFRSVRDYPDEAVFAATQSAWLARDSTPTAIILVSRQTKDMLVIRAHTRPDWFEKTMTDRISGTNETWLMCPRRLLQPFAEFAGDMKAYLGSCPV